MASPRFLLLLTLSLAAALGGVSEAFAARTGSASALTGPQSGDAARLALDYARERRATFGDLDGLRLRRREHDGRLTRLTWTQALDGVPVADGVLKAVVADDGRIVSIGGGAQPLPDLETEPTLSAERALARAAAATADHRPAPAVLHRERAGDRETRFAGDAEAALVITNATGEPRLAWHVVRPQGDAVYDQLVDARTGKELQRENRVSGATGFVYDAWPGAPWGGSPRTADMTGWLAPGATTLTGPFAHVYADVNANDNAESTEEIGPVNGNWNYPRTWFNGPKCPAAGCSWSWSSQRSWMANREQTATNVFGLLQTFHDHLAAAPFNFDGFSGADAIQAEVLDGAEGSGGGWPNGEHRNNADMYAPKEGRAPRMQLYLFGEPFDTAAAMSASEDASIVFHEYTHGFNHRTVVDATGWSRLFSRQSRALDEALGDFLALDLLVERGAIVDTPAPKEVWEASHADPAHSGRTLPIDCPVGMCAGANGLSGGYTYGQFGRIRPDEPRPEPHYDGEIIAQTLWDLRTRFVTDLQSGPGLERVRRLVADALRDVPPDPSFLDFRDAMLAADAYYGHADRRRIWEVFAHRGMGWFASTLSGDDDRPVEDFKLPPDLSGTTVTGTVTDRATGAPLRRATVWLDAEELSTVTDEQGRFELTDVPAGDYPHLFAERDGYERAVVDKLAVGAGGADVAVGMRRNWADARGGATLTASTGPDHGGDGCGPRQAFDGDRLTGWTTQTDAQPSVTIALPADVTVTSFGLDPTPRIGFPCNAGADEGVPAAVKIEVAGADGDFHEAIDTTIEASAAHRQLELRPEGPLEDVRHVRLTLRGNHSAPTDKDVGMSELLVFASPKRAPRAAFAVAPGAPDVGQPITLDATASRPGSADITSYAWDLDGDGAFERVELGRTASVTFDEPGLHRIGLRVTGADGESDTTRRTVSVGTGVELFDLGTVDDDRGTASARQISAGGVVTGVSGDGAFRYRDGSMAGPLALPAGHTWGVAYQANDLGLVAGSTAPGPEGPQHAVIWDDAGVPTDLTADAASWGEAIGVNAAGWVVGHTMDARRLVAPFIKPPGNPVQDVEELAGVPADERYRAHLKKVNGLGVAVGCRSDSYTECVGAIRYDHATRSLTGLPVPFPRAGATDVNDAGTVTGAGWDLTGRQHAVTWSAAGVASELPGLGGSVSEAVAINAGGDIVGRATDVTGAARAVRWHGGAIEDLNAYARGTGWKLQDADGINARGEIVGTGVLDGVVRAFQLNLGPCRVCIADVRFQEPDVPGDRWHDAGADGISDGNPLRVVVTLRNDDTRAHIVRVRAQDETSGEAIGEGDGPVSLDAGETKTVELPEVDTDGFAWKDGQAVDEHVVRVRTTLGHTTYSSRAAVLKVRPRPLVLVPGMFAEADDWDGYAEMARRAHPEWDVLAVGDGAYPGAIDTGSFAGLATLERPKSIAANADELGRYVEALRADLDAQRVDVVAHSVGGLIARRWIHTSLPDQAREVVHLIQLGTPNMGTPCAEGLPSPAWTPYRRDAMERFNATVTERRGVAFSVLAGTVLPAVCNELSTSDGLVTSESARWEIADYAELPLWHVALASSGTAFTSFVLPRLNGTKAVAAAPGALAPKAAAAQVRAGTAFSHQLLADRTAAVGPGEAVSLPFDVDGGARLRVTVLAAADVGAELVDPAGQVVAAVGAGEKAARGLFRTLTADAPAVGAWRRGRCGSRGEHTSSAP